MDLANAPAAAECFIELDDGAEGPLKGSGLVQLGSEQATLGVQHLQVVHDASVVARA